jgi:hypothetical protein
VRSPLALVLAPELRARLVSSERLEESSARQRRKTGIAALDAVFGGGWPRAALCEVAGRRSSGRTAILLSTLAEAVAAGEAAALVDAGGSLDPRAAAAAGLTLPALLWIRCTPAQALKATDLVVAAGGFGVVGLDVCDARLRAPAAAWMRLAHLARAQGTTLLVASADRLTGTHAAAALELGNVTPGFLTDGPPLLAGIRVRATRVRADRRAPQPGDTTTCVSLAFTSRS